MYSPTSSHEKPTPESTVALIAVKIMGSRMGKPKTAVNVELLFVLAAIADTKVRIPEMPKLPNSKITRNMPLFSNGLPNKTVKNSQLIKAINKSKMPLKINFESIIACGLHKL